MCNVLDGQAWGPVRFPELEGSRQGQMDLRELIGQLVFPKQWAPDLMKDPILKNKIEGLERWFSS